MSLKFLYRTNHIGVKALTLEELSGGYPNWFSDLEVCAYNSHGAYAKSPQSIKEYVQSLDNNVMQLVWAVYHLEDNVHIGNVSLRIFNRIDNNAELGFLFGEKAYWGRGLASDAGRIMVYHGFNVLNLHRIYCAMAATNLGMVSLAKKSGFTEEGRRRENIFLQGHYVDEIEFGLLKREFTYVPAKLN